MYCIIKHRKKYIKKHSKNDTSKSLIKRSFLLCNFQKLKYMEKLLYSLNLPKLTFHSLRHTFATQAIELGIDYKTISEILGHSNISTTLNLYIHPKTEHKRKCLDLVYQNLKTD